MRRLGSNLRRLLLLSQNSRATQHFHSRILTGHNFAFIQHDEGRAFALPSETSLLYGFPTYGGGLYGRLVERSMTPSLYLGVGVSSTYRGFESHTFRHSPWSE